MPNIPFGGGVPVALWKLPYTLPLNSYVSPFRWMPDSFARIDGSPEITFRLRGNAAIQYSVTNACRSSDLLGAPYQSIGIDYSCIGVSGLPQKALFTFPSSGAISLTFADVVASGGPPGWDAAPNGSAFPAVNINGILGYWFSASGSDGNTYNAFILPDGTTYGWFDPPFYQFGEAFFQDIPNARTDGLYQDGGGNTYIMRTFISATGVVSPQTFAPFLTAGSVGGATWLDSPAYSYPANIPGSLTTLPAGLYWALLGDNQNGAVPLVTNGSPIFLLAPDLSAFYEVIFTSTDPTVQKNDQGGYGPPFDYTDLVSTGTLVTFDPSGNLYYLQVDSGGTFVNVYSSIAPTPPTPPGGPIIIEPTTLPFLPLPACAGEACVVF